MKYSLLLTASLRQFSFWSKIHSVGDILMNANINVSARVAEVGVLAETAKYPSMLARSARLQIFATKNTVFYNCKFLQHKSRFLR